ncbi:MAG: DsbA family protein [Myxococcota bacterium]
MSTLSGIDRARLSVLLDLRHPLAYLALHPAIEFGASMGIEINWLPLTTPTLSPPTSVQPSDDRGTRHRHHRARAIAREIEIYSQQQGLVVCDYYRKNSADAGNLGWLWVRERYRDRLQPYLTELFRLYWSVQLEPSSADQIATLLESVKAGGASFRKWCTDEGPSTAAALADELRGLGMFQVPTFVVDDEVFIGRQHLPMIRWVLDGRSGPIPI